MDRQMQHTHTQPLEKSHCNERDCSYVSSYHTEYQRRWLCNFLPSCERRIGLVLCPFSVGRPNRQFHGICPLFTWPKPDILLIIERKVASWCVTDYRSKTVTDLYASTLAVGEVVLGVLL